jgi:hypothetical protein
MIEDNEEHACHDLQNIKYKTMMLSGPKKTFTSSLSTEMDAVDKLLDMEMQNNRNITWSRLDRMTRVKKLNDYANKYGKENDMSQEEISSLKAYLVMSMQKKKRLLKTREVKYNKETETIESIPILQFNATNRKFTLKRSDKRTSTLSSLGGGNSGIDAVTRRKRSGIKKTDKNESGIKISQGCKEDDSN